MKKLILSTLAVMLLISSSWAQSEAPENWFNLDNSKDGVMGVSTEEMYKNLLKGRTSQSIIVAVIDSGVDSEHEDLKDVMWINEDEIPGNGIDDDNNGYIDDIHGWNFIGGKNGENVHHDTYEITRLYAKYSKMFDGADVSKLSKKNKKMYKKYEEIKKKVEEERGKFEQQMGQVTMMTEAIGTVKGHFGDKKETITGKDLAAIETDDDKLKQAVAMLSNILGEEGTIAGFEGQISRASDYFSNSLNYGYNPDFKPRSIVGDNYLNSYQKGYGNNDVKGPDAGHGTHVAGIIAAVRDNDLGIKGVADNVQIMSVRTVPDGDERDKDVANAIIYAVDNGASIINMSFGKSYSWDKTAVDKAVKYARKKDVLLVHAAGNDARFTAPDNNFPNDKYAKRGWFSKKNADNWLEIGALSWKKGEDAIATFSNYAKENVDIFAPGVQINSTIPDGGYAKFSGTSMASPVTAGVAAVLRSYFPTLTAKQVKEIIMNSAVKTNEKVKKPGSDEVVYMSELCQTGGIVNASSAVKLAMKTKGKKKIKKSKNKKKVAIP